MEDSPEVLPEPANLRFLRRLITGLTATMIIGLLAIFTLIVITFSRTTGTQALTDIALPAGVTATAYTRGSNWYAVVTDDSQILIYNMDQTLRQTIQIANE
jgi:hypothetical protein